MTEGKARQEPETAGHITWTVKSRGNECILVHWLAYAQLDFPTHNSVERLLRQCLDPQWAGSSHISKFN